jgi:hypothetical protein
MLMFSRNFGFSPNFKALQTRKPYTWFYNPQDCTLHVSIVDLRNVAASLHSVRATAVFQTGPAICDVW